MKSACCLSFILLCWLSSACLAADASREKADYVDWILRYAKKELKGRTMDGKPAPLKLVVTTVEQEGSVDRVGNFAMSRETVDSEELIMDGHRWGYSKDQMGTKSGGGGNPLPESTLQRLDALLAALPDDALRLPPPNRRLLLQTMVQGKTVERVYDRANAPDSVWEILHLMECPIRAFVPEFKPQSELTARSFDHGGFLSLSPDGKQVLFNGHYCIVQFWDITTHEFLREVHSLDSKGVAFSPDGAQALIYDRGDCDVFDTRTWQRTQRLKAVSSPQFLPDGRHVLFQSYKRPLQVYDAGNWQQVDHLPTVPDDAQKFIPASKTQRAVIQSKAGHVSLWDIGLRREIAKLRENAGILQATFSPDETLVAITLRSTLRVNYWSGLTIGIWSAETGQLLHDLLPFERTQFDLSTGLMWSPDGKYLLVATGDGASSDYAISVFNARTGRHRGEFSGSYRINGIALLPDASELVAGDEDGKIHFWDFQEALAAIREFEASLPKLPGQ